MRDPIANKTHYANGNTLLDKQFKEIYEHSKGPGTLPVNIDKTTIQIKEPVKAIIVPHAAYELAGPCASWAYKALGEENKDLIYFIIAQSQSSTECGTTMETFKMPYAEVRCEQNIVRELVQKGNIKINDELHRKENIIEIQLPFLQFINKKQIEKIKIVPIIVGPDTNIQELSADIKEVLMELNKEAAFIFVSNLTSYGRSFHYVPFTEEVIENIEKIDSQIIEAIKNHSDKELTAIVEKTQVPISGIYALKLYFKLISAGKVTVEQHYLSGEINDNFKNCVSYASFTIK